MNTTICRSRYLQIIYIRIALYVYVEKYFTNITSSRWNDGHFAKNIKRLWVGVVLGVTISLTTQAPGEKVENSS